MSLFLEIMKEELERNINSQKSLMVQLNSIHKGYLSQCKIDNKIYVYRKWREGNKIVSEYIGVPDDEKVNQALEERRQYLAIQSTLRSLKQEEKKLRKAIRYYV